MSLAIKPACETGTRNRGHRFASLIAIWISFSFSPTPKAAAAVRVIALQPSSPHPRISVHFDGKPLRNASIKIFQDGSSSEQPRLTVISDEDGSVKIPELPSGNYRFFVSAKPKLRGDLYLSVSTSVSNNASKFTIDLECCAPPTFEEIVASAEDQPVKDHLKSFEGLVTDPIGTRIPNAAIDVVVKGTQGKVHAASLHSDLNGKFSAHLKDGKYIVFFSSPGFSVRVVPISISQEDGNGQLHVKLNIGPSS